MTININVYPDLPDVGALAWRDGQAAVTRQIEDRVQRVVDQFGAIARAAGRLEFLIKDAHNTSGALNDLHRAIIREVDILNDVRLNARRLNDMVVHERTHDLENQLTGIDALIEALGGIDPQVHQALFPVAPAATDETDQADLWLERVLQYEAEHGQDRIMFQAHRRQDAIEKLTGQGETYLMLDVDMSLFYPSSPIWLLPKKFFDWAADAFPGEVIPIYRPTPAPEAPTVPNSPIAEIARLAYDVREEQLATGYKVFPSSLAPVARRFKNREKAEDMRLASPGLFDLLDQDMSAYDPSGMSWWVLNRWFVEWLRERRPKLVLPLWDPMQTKEHHE